MEDDFLVNKRKHLKLTQEEVANIAGITRSYYTQIESGSKRPSPIVAQKIAELLNFDWTLFFAY